MGGVLNYSTTEQDTGLLWVDGKHVYQKTIDCGNGPNNTSKNVAHGIANLDRIIEWNVVGKHVTISGTNYFIPFGPSRSSTNDWALEIYTDTTNITLKTYNNWDNTSIYITILYTKST